MSLLPGVSERALRETVRRHGCYSLIGGKMYLELEDFEQLLRKRSHVAQNQRRGGVAYIHGTINGERIRKSLGTRNPKIAAARKAEEEARLQRAAIYGIAQEATFAEACIQYLKHQAPTRHYLEPI